MLLSAPWKLVLHLIGLYLHAANPCYILNYMVQYAQSSFDVSFAAPIELQRERPRFATQIMIKEDRAAVLGQLGALHTLHEAEPRINIVPGHDGGAVEQLIDARLMKRRFQIAASNQGD